MLRSILEAGRRRPNNPWGGSPPREVSANAISLTPSLSTLPSELSDDLILDQANDTKQPSSDAEILERARATHKSVDFVALAAGPELGGPWQRVEAADRFVVFRLQASKTGDSQPEASINDKSESGPEVLCAGRLTASLEEVASILRPATEAEHNAAMVGLYAKRFIFGSLERSIPCSTATKDCSSDDVASSVDEQLAVKTSSFLRTSLFASNEQWCYLDFFQRKRERDGFTIFQQALTPSESTPGRVLGAHARVNQLHDLNASYLVDLLPNRKGLRVVFNAWFDSAASTTEESNQSPSSGSRRPSSASSSGSRSSLSDNGSDLKAQTRRLLALARGVTKLPELVRRRRFGVQVPADLAAIFVSNPRCPCCTRSLAPVKLSLAVAASAIASRSLAPLKMDTRRCYLCGYLVCIDCWTAEEMETTTGRVAAIVVCTRCHACVEACDYSEVCAPDRDDDHHRGPVRVVADRSPRSDTTPLLVDFLMVSLTQAPRDSSERADVLAVVRTLLLQDGDDNQQEEGDDVLEDENQAAAKLERLLTDEKRRPPLDACRLANAKQRNYALDLPSDPETDVPRGPIPSNEDVRLSAAEAAGMLLLADRFAPEHPSSASLGPESTDTLDIRDLVLICELAVRTLSCAGALVSVMGVRHEHVLASTDPGFAGSAIPREQTMCQHQLMMALPFMLTHPEADVRFQAQVPTRQVPLRFYVGFPVVAPLPQEDGDIAVGTLCCFDTKPRAELTHSQYATMQTLARTASKLVQLKGRQIQQQSTSVS